MHPSASARRFRALHNEPFAMKTPRHSWRTAAAHSRTSKHPRDQLCRSSKARTESTANADDSWLRSSNMFRPSPASGHRPLLACCLSANPANYGKQSFTALPMRPYLYRRRITSNRRTLDLAELFVQQRDARDRPRPRWPNRGRCRRRTCRTSSGPSGSPAPPARSR